MKFGIVTRLIYILIFLSGFNISGARAQSYGLGFYGQEAVQDRRTGLELSSEVPLCVKENFTLSFDFAFLTNKADYFGYIVRIIDSQGNNIDLIYDRHDVSNKRFRLIKGDRFSSITFDLDTGQLYGSWTTLKFAFSADGKQLRFSCGKEEFTEAVSLNGIGCFKILFGRNDFDSFKTTDVPAMKVRNVKILEGEKLAYHWPLNQAEGLRAREVLQGRDARVVNPMWLKNRHMEWQLLYTHSIRGEASVAFDPDGEQIYVVGADSLLRYTVSAGKTEMFGYRSGALSLVNGSQSVFDTGGDRLLNFSVDQRIVSGFDPQQQTWDHTFLHPAPGTHFLHLNKFYSATDSSIYFIGGYGHYLYKDSVFRYHVPSKSWTFIRPGGDSFTPRYLAALGATKTGAYIVGGYGSTSGQQLLNPKNLYDFLYFNRAERTIEKKFELNVKKEDFVFANSLIIDEARDSWYGLIFPKHKYHSSLQLIKGSLSDSAFSLAGNRIPYQFHDVNSFADLFYCRKSKRFLAVTIFRNGAGMANVKLYSLFSPPLPPVPARPAVQVGLRTVLAPAGIFLTVLLLLLFLYRLKKRREKSAFTGSHKEHSLDQKQTVTLQVASVPAPREQPQFLTRPVTRTSDKSDTPAVNAVFLFGDLQLFNRDGKDVTSCFTPLLKELFLILLLHSVRGGKGVSSDTLTELLWYDKSPVSARNNRSVNIAKLKSILREIGDNSRIHKEGSYWKLKLDRQQVYIDYRNYLDIISERKQLDKEKIIALLEIVRRGAFLSQADYEWLDPFKSKLCNEITDTYIHFAHMTSVNEEPDFLIQVADSICCFDSLNEDAMTIKCKALVQLGKHSLATQAFEHFCKKYRQIYGEEFNRDFKSIIQ